MKGITRHAMCMSANYHTHTFNLKPRLQFIRLEFNFRKNGDCLNWRLRVSSAAILTDNETEVDSTENNSTEDSTYESKYEDSKNWCYKQSQIICTGLSKVANIYNQKHAHQRSRVAGYDNRGDKITARQWSRHATAPLPHSTNKHAYQRPHSLRVSSTR
jgi:hypothetical protein